MADRVCRRGKRKTVQFRGMFVWTIVFYFYNIFLTICILKRVPLTSYTVLGMNNFPISGSYSNIVLTVKLNDDMTSELLKATIAFHFKYWFFAVMTGSSQLPIQAHLD